MTRYRRLLLGLALLLPLVAVVGAGLGAYPVAPWDVPRALLDGGTTADVLRVVRFPRVVLGIVVGAGLALSGAVLQGVFRNPLADPGLIGVTGRPDSGVDVLALREAWLALEDTHDFHRVLRKAEVTRTQALRLAGSDLAWRVAADALRRVLQRTAAAEIPIMIFVGNPGMTQIHSGPVRRIVDTPPWCNVLDPGLDLHVRESGIAESWVVRKPTRNGIITSLELYDEDGKQIVLIVSKRSRDTEESAAWRGIVASLGSGAVEARP